MGRKKTSTLQPHNSLGGKGTTRELWSRSRRSVCAQIGGRRLNTEKLQESPKESAHAGTKRGRGMSSRHDASIAITSRRIRRASNKRLLKVPGGIASVSVTWVLESSSRSDLTNTARNL